MEPRTPNGGSREDKMIGLLRIGCLLYLGEAMTF